MPLTDTQIRNAKAGDRPIKLRVSHGLYLEVRPTGSKLWRYRYRIDGKENIYAAGEYVSPPRSETKSETEERIRGGRLTLQEACIKRQEWRGLVKQGIHPAQHRRIQVAQTISAGKHTFEAITLDWLEKKGVAWTPKNRLRIERALKREVFPSIGKLPIRSVTPQHLLQIMQKVEAGGAPTIAILIRQWCFRIFNHAIATLRADRNPAAGDIKDAIARPRVRNHPALLRRDIKPLVTAIRGYGGEEATKIALELLLLTFVRAQELRGAEWQEIDFQAQEWRIPASRMKMRSPHIVPLSTQAVALFRRLQPLTSRQKFLFPNSKTPGTYMASTTMNAALVRLGYEGRFSPHGFRATASTMLNEMGFAPDWIERQLAHTQRGVRAIYNRAEHLAERRAMMQQWADMVDAMVNGADVVPIKRKTNA